MNIAHVIPNSIVLPPKIHNGRYDWVLRLASLQVDDGHDVTIYCNPQSRLDNIKTIGIKNAADNRKLNNTEIFLLALKSDHDIYHSHFDNLHYEIADRTKKPIVFTQHWQPHAETVDLANSKASHNVWAVPPTNYMYEQDQQLGIQSKGPIYHGIDTDLFKDNSTPKSKRLLFVGRIAPEKNLDQAISIAKRANIGLDIIGKIPEKYHEYWESLEQLVDGVSIKYLGPKTQKELIGHYASALALLFPSDINEPFGLVAIEAQACGTPVIMKSGGSRGELVEDGKTGFLCLTEEDFVRAAQIVSSLRSLDCRNFANRFDIHGMVQAYDRLYQSLLA